MFTITCDEISRILLEAKQRGVQIRIISDNDQVGLLMYGLTVVGMFDITGSGSSGVQHRGCAALGCIAM